jgi:hypothetical protein
MLFTALLAPELFTGSYPQTRGVAKLEQCFDRLTEGREQWPEAGLALHGIWRALSISGPANHVAPAASPPQEF